MVTSVQSGQSAIELKEQPARLRIPAQRADNSELRERLSFLLQSSLNLDDILQIFFEQIQSIVTVRGLFYQHHTEGYQLQLGNNGAHSSSYRINTNDDVLGELVFSRGKRFSEQELATLEGLIGSLVYPLRNGLQYRTALQSALRDPLTGVGNRIALDNALDREIQLSERYDTPLSLLVIDLDFFKRINDTYGHSCGDDVLCEIARSIVAVTRQTDMTFRYGGEEFVVVLNKTDAEGAAAIAERIRKFVERVRIETHQELIQTTISIGTSTLEKGETQKDLFDRADRALYRAKEEGRNRVVKG